MKIDTNYYDYYNLNSLANVLANKSTDSSNTDEQASQSTAGVSAVSARKTSEYVSNSSYMDLSISGRRVSDSIQNQDENSSVILENVQKIKEDMDSIKTADIDSMTADQIKETLSNLQNDKNALQTSIGNSENTDEIDLDSMSDEELKNLLKDVQDKAQNPPAMGGGKPPMMGGAPPKPGAGPQGVSGTAGTSETDETDSTGKYFGYDTLEEYLESLEEDDIDDMTSDEVKQALTSIKNSLNKSEGTDSDKQESELDSMSETDMKQLLKDIQSDVQNRAGMENEQPPMMQGGRPPMMNQQTLKTDTVSANENTAYNGYPTLEEYLAALYANNSSSSEI